MERIRQVWRLGQVLRQPGGLQAFLHWKPFSITAFGLLRRLAGQGLAFSTILDGGANEGQFARAAAETYPEAQVLSFEPLPDLAAQVRQHLADCPQVQVHATALGSHDGTLTFYRNAYSLASSALPLEDGSENVFPHLRQLQPVEVPVARLDTLLRDEPLPSPVLLKLDLQGFELEALKGAVETLQRTDYVLLEASFEQVYQGEPLFDELYAFLRQAGFRFLQPLDVLEGATGEIVQMDVLFGRPYAPEPT